MADAYAKQMKKDEPYLNSVKRVTIRMIFSILEFIAMFIVLSILLDYLKTGTLDPAHITETLKSMLNSDSVLALAIISFVPIMVFENIGIYFGLGTVPRMVFSIAKILMVLAWFYILVTNSNTIDLLKMSGLDNGEIMGIESFTVNLSPLFNLISIIMLLCCAIPIAEYIGARKKHKEALARHNAAKGIIQD